MNENSGYVLQMNENSGYILYSDNTITFIAKVNIFVCVISDSWSANMFCDKYIPMGVHYQCKKKLNANSIHHKLKYISNK